MSAAENDGESEGRFPTVRHAHLLGLIGRSQFSALAQAEESEDRRRLDWDRCSRHLQKGTQNHREQLEGQLYITEKNIKTLGDAIMTGGLLRKVAVDLDLV